MVPIHDIDVDLPLRVVSGAIPERLDAIYAAGGWFRPVDHRIRHLLDAYACLVGARIRPGGVSVRVRKLADPLRDAEIAAGRILQKGLFTPVPRGAGRDTHLMGRHGIHDADRAGLRVRQHALPGF